LTSYQLIVDARCQFHQHFIHSFLYDSGWRSFSLITVWLYNFLEKEYWCKSSSVLMKLTTGVIFTIMFMSNFYVRSSQKRNKTVKSSVSFFGIGDRILAQKLFVK